MPAKPLGLKRHRKSLAALLLFVIYAVTLFVHNLNVQRRLEQNLIDGAGLELARRPIPCRPICPSATTPSPTWPPPTPSPTTSPAATWA
jgi:hypothetical protein